jgi:acetyl esterase
MTTTSAFAPGRLGNPALEMRSDPRSDPRMVAALAPFGLDGAGAPPPVGATSPRADRLEFAMAGEAGFEAVFAALVAGLPEAEVERRTETIEGGDGNPVTLHISRPRGATGPLPGVLHLHGGGMVILQAEGPMYCRIRDELATTGLVVVGVEFRNGAGLLGAHPFPAGLDDCMSALHWMHEHRDALGVSSITVAGESGGGNLTLATALRAKRDGGLHMIDGVYAMVPYISGAYADPPPELPSLVENQDYFLGSALMPVMASLYDEGEHATDPLAWPYYAGADDLAGLPPHVISVCELDPLRDEGAAYYRKLVAAGVPARGRVVLGVGHAGDLMFRRDIPENYWATLHDIHAFCAR